jgi:hypothetical protein
MFETTEDDDSICGHWIKDLFYFFELGQNYESSKRRYILHDNDIVFDPDDISMELYQLRQKGVPGYVIPTRMFPYSWVKNYFMVWDKTQPSNEIRKEGKVMARKKMNLTELLFFCLPPPRITHVKILIKADEVQYVDKGKIPKSVEKNKKFSLLEPTVSLKRMPPGKNEPRFYMELLPNFPTRKYDPKEKEQPGVWHSGQRKLLLSEVEFLTRFDPKQNYLVLYAGAASGDHIPIDSFLFENCYFVLFDPSPFRISPSRKIAIRRGLFDDKVVEEFKGEKIILISDIRSTPMVNKEEEEKYNKEFEEGVMRDLGLQEKWIKELDTYSSLLKFRTPFEGDSITYYQAPILFQAFAPKHSSETRMMVKGEEKMIEYSREKYENQMSYFNNVYRPSTFYSTSPFFGKNYDTTKESQIWAKYIEKQREQNPSVAKIVKYIFSVDEFLTSDIKKKVLPFLLS